VHNDQLRIKVVPFQKPIINCGLEIRMNYV